MKNNWIEHFKIVSFVAILVALTVLIRLILFQREPTKLKIEGRFAESVKRNSTLKEYFSSLSIFRFKIGFIKNLTKRRGN